MTMMVMMVRILMVMLVKMVIDLDNHYEYWQPLITIVESFPSTCFSINKNCHQLTIDLNYCQHNVNDDMETKIHTCQKMLTYFSIVQRKMLHQQ